MRRWQLSLRSELDHLDGSLHKTAGKTLKTGAVVAVRGQNSSLPANPDIKDIKIYIIYYIAKVLPVVGWFYHLLHLFLLGEYDQLDHPCPLPVQPGHQVPPLGGVVGDTQPSLLEGSSNVTLVILDEILVKYTEITGVLPWKISPKSNLSNCKEKIIKFKHLTDCRAGRVG